MAGNCIEYEKKQISTYFRIFWLHMVNAPLGTIRNKTSDMTAKNVEICDRMYKTYSHC